MSTSAWLKFEFWMIRGRFEKHRADFDAALSCFQQALVYIPDNLLAQSYVGYCYERLDRCKDAALAFERGLQIRSDSAYCHAGLGRAYSYLGSCREAIDSFNRAFRIDSNQEKQGSNILSLAFAYAGLGDYERSAKFYSDAARLLPDNADAHLGLGCALRSMGRSKEAEAPLLRAISLTPDSAASHYELGNVHLDLERKT
jgi:tetratricopeptide (TPR) repeat protein